jgi:hypothetical protein
MPSIAIDDLSPNLGGHLGSVIRPDDHNLSTVFFQHAMDVWPEVISGIVDRSVAGEDTWAVLLKAFTQQVVEDDSFNTSLRFVDLVEVIDDENARTTDTMRRKLRLFLEPTIHLSADD